MSMIIETFLICDGCAETSGVDDRTQNYSARELRDSAKKDGWIYIIEGLPKKGKDLCFECKNKIDSKKL